jgi:hypothetical protein
LVLKRTKHNEIVLKIIRIRRIMANEVHERSPLVGASASYNGTFLFQVSICSKQSHLP